MFGKLRPYLRKYWLADFSGVCSSEIWVLKSINEHKFINKYIYNIVQTNHFIQLCNLSTGSKMPRADWNYVKDQSIAVTTIVEQEKISKFLILLDKKIELQESKIDALKIYKKRTIAKFKIKF